MDERVLYGARVAVRSRDGTIDLGLGTHIGETFVEMSDNKPLPRILLDTGECIDGFSCRWTVLGGMLPRRPFVHTLRQPARVFNNRGLMLSNTGEALPRSTEVVIQRLYVMTYDHNTHVTGAIRRSRRMQFLLTEELIFPEFGA